MRMTLLSTAKKPAAAAKKTLEQFTEDIDAATDKEAADKVLAAARDVLSADDFATLELSHQAAWTEA